VSNHDDLGAVYSDISIWRSKLKALNVEVADAQQEAFTDISEGINTKGWLIIGRNVRHLPGCETIEGRAKEDIRWEELQQQGGRPNALAFWLITALTGVILAASRES